MAILNLIFIFSFVLKNVQEFSDTLLCSMQFSKNVIPYSSGKESLSIMASKSESEACSRRVA